MASAEIVQTDSARIPDGFHSDPHERAPAQRVGSGRVGRNRREVDSSTTSSHLPEGVGNENPSYSNTDFGTWITYQDEKEAIAAEAEVLTKRLKVLRRRYRECCDAQDAIDGRAA